MIHEARIRTKRLLLRPLTVSDADEVWEWVSDERVAQYMVYPVYTQKEKVKEWLLSLRSGEQSVRERHFHFGFERISDGKLIGSGDIGIEKNGDCWGFGYNFRHDCWGMGYATEAVRAMMEFAHDEYGAVRFASSCCEPNRASAHVMEKCGLHFAEYGLFQKLDGSCPMRSMRYEGEYGG